MALITKNTVNVTFERLFWKLATKWKALMRMMAIRVIKSGNFLIKFLFNLIEFLLLIYVNNVNYVSYIENLMLIVITLWILINLMILINRLFSKYIA